MLALQEAEATLDFDYVQSATMTIADWLSQRPAVPRGEVMGRFQNENNVIWSPDIVRSASRSTGCARCSGRLSSTRDRGD